jgi:hypothetical protein
MRQPEVTERGGTSVSILLRNFTPEKLEQMGSSKNLFDLLTVANTVVSQVVPENSLLHNMTVWQFTDVLKAYYMVSTTKNITYLCSLWNITMLNRLVELSTITKTKSGASDADSWMGWLLFIGAAGQWL